MIHTTSAIKHISVLGQQFDFAGSGLTIIQEHTKKMHLLAQIQLVMDEYARANSKVIMADVSLTAVVQEKIHHDQSHQRVCWRLPDKTLAIIIT